MSNYNLSRGEDLFFKETDNLISQYPQYTKQIKNLAAQFFGKVGVMPLGNLTEVNFSDDGNFELNATPSYKKLCNSILYTIENCKDENIKSLVEFVVKSYNKTSSTKTIIKDKEINPDNLLLNKSIEENYSNLLEQIQITDNLDDSIKFMDVENIDLLDDFDDDDLSMEGKRSTGMIDTNFDTLENIEMKINHRNKIKEGILEVMDDGSFIITCPHTGSTNVYQIDSSTYASFETDQPFKITFNLADLKPD